MSYSESEVKKATLHYYNGDELATKVWMDKYALKNKEGVFEELTPVDMYKRITEEIIRIEKTKYDTDLDYNKLYNLFKDKYFTYAGSCLFGIGNPYQLTSLGNCFVIGEEEDSYSSILQIDAEQVQLMKRRGGVGHDLSHLRPKNSRVNNAANTSTGAVSFAHRYSNTTREVAQEGRRGALMLTMDINHPDSEDFIMVKDDLTKVTGANISVKVHDKFMEAVEDNLEYDLSFPINSDNIKKRKAKDLWNKLVHQAWKNAEPGILFWDRIIEESPADCYKNYKTKSTNPCGEVPLSQYDSCRLGSIILTSYVRNPFTSDPYFDFELLANNTYFAQRLMDDLIDLESEKIYEIINKIEKDKTSNNIELNLWKKIHTTLLNGRRTGLGMLGLADVFAMMGIAYDSDDAMDFAEEIANVIAVNSYRSSIDMAKYRGAFPEWNYKAEKDNPFINRILLNLQYCKKDKDYIKYGRRNIANLSIAPTGTLAIIFQTTSGIEPVFNLSYTRRRKTTEDNPNKSFKDQNGDWWENYIVYHPLHKKWLELNTKKEFNNLVVFGETIINSSPYIGSTANEINPIQKIRMQGKIQKWIDHSISVTHNLPKETTEEQVSEFFWEAWLNGCKGVTIYREGSRSGVLINEEETTINFNYNNAPKRPKRLPCDIYSIKVKGEQFIVSVGLLDDKPYEVFAFQFNDKFDLKHGILQKQTKGKYDILTPSLEVYSEDITSGMTQSEEDRTRMISTALRHGADIKFIVEQLNKSKSDITSFSKAIARVLNKYIKTPIIVTDKCPECKLELSYEGGCLTCKNCGWSKCN